MPKNFFIIKSYLNGDRKNNLFRMNYKNYGAARENRTLMGFANGPQPCLSTNFSMAANDASD